MNRSRVECDLQGETLKVFFANKRAILERIPLQISRLVSLKNLTG
jgi:hypothetical protein